MEETLHSILNQTFTDFELILSDNGEIAEAYARQDDRIRYCPKRENYGGRLECASRLRARRHIGQSSTILPARLIQPRLRLTNRYCTLPCPEWWDPAKARALTFPEFRQLLEYFLSIYRAPLGAGQKLRCYFLLLPWI
jgi:glycosyltransferase involved in cell wall biosynthesis